jgi:Ca2+-binding RTX toxin-like protein
MAMHIKVNAGEVYNGSNSLDYLLSHSTNAALDPLSSTGASYLVETHYRYGTVWVRDYGHLGRILAEGYKIYPHSSENKFYDFRNKTTLDHISAAITEAEPFPAGLGFGKVWEDRVAWKMSGEPGVGFEYAAFLRAAEALHGGNTVGWSAYYNSFNWNFIGAENNDVFYGGDLADTIVGGSGQDALGGGGGRDYISGGDDIDILAGGDDDDALHGGNGNDQLYGGNGNDLLAGGAGGDALDGGDGIDLASYLGPTATTGVIVYLYNSVWNTGEAKGDSYLSIENLSGTNFFDRLYGDEKDNLIWGNGGDDVLSGNGGRDNLRGGYGNDRLYGGIDDDTLTGGAGADVLDGAAGWDTANYNEYTTTAGVTASLDNPLINTGEAAGDTYSSVEYLIGTKFIDVLIGNSGVNRIEGLDGSDALYGLAGADTLEGGGGIDFLEGGLGGDVLKGGGEFDFAMYAFATAGVTANLKNYLLNAGEAAGDYFDSIEGIGGSNFNDILTGDGSNNVINGGLGNDVLAGGLGPDAFVFSTVLNASTNVDTLTDFNVVDDVMWLENNGIFAKLTTPGALNVANFRTGTAALDSNDFVVYNKATGDIFYDADGNGAGAAIKFAHVTANTALTEADFLVV